MDATRYTHCQPGLLLETVGEDREIFLQLVDIYVDESAEKLKKMRQAATASDFEQLRQHSHALKGTVGPLGAEALMQMLIQVEDECDRKQCQCDEARMLSIERESDLVRQEVRDFVAHLDVAT